jgi:hypothetical protein
MGGGGTRATRDAHVGGDVTLIIIACIMPLHDARYIFIDGVRMLVIMKLLSICVMLWKLLCMISTHQVTGKTLAAG